MVARKEQNNSYVTTFVLTHVFFVYHQSFKERRGLKSIKLEASLDDEGEELDIEDTGAEGKIKLEYSKSWSGSSSGNNFFEIDLDLKVGQCLLHYLLINKKYSLLHTLGFT